MEKTEQEIISDKDALRARHASDYIPISNGEGFNLAYEQELRSKPSEFFHQLSKYHFLNRQQKAGAGTLTRKELMKELQALDSDETNVGSFWKQFSAKKLTPYLNLILQVEKWQDLINSKHPKDKAVHDDLLKTIYLLAHLHKAEPSFLKQLAEFDDVWSVEFRHFYPRCDFVDSEYYGACLSEFCINALYNQPISVRVAIKNLDTIIDKLVEHYQHPIVQEVLSSTSPDKDLPSLKVLKYSYLAGSFNYSALNSYLSPLITGEFTADSPDILRERSRGRSGAQLPASYNDYRIVAAMCVKAHSAESPHFLEDEHKMTVHEVIFSALAADANRGLRVESQGSKYGQRDTSIAASVKKLAKRNPNTIEGVFNSQSPDFSGVPEIHTKYLYLRSQYACLVAQGTGREIEMINNIQLDRSRLINVHQYIFNNNLEKILEDMVELEMILGQVFFPRGLIGLPSR